MDVPFQLDKDAVRRGETHVHEALREALVNTLIHADHLSSRPIKIIKHGHAFRFSNPGRLGIPIQRLFEGGLSDPRNPNLQKMFQMIGLGEKAGSGFQKILRAWKGQQWAYPLVSEEFDVEMTSVVLPMISMIPEDVEKEIKGIVGPSYASLKELDRIVLVLTHRFGEVYNADIKQYRPEHPREIGERLRFLVDHGWLVRSGQGRGARYRLPGELTPDLFTWRADGSAASSEQRSSLQKIAALARKKGRVPKEIMRKIILELCSEEYLQLRTLSDLLKRRPDSIRNHYVNPMVTEGLLTLRYPTEPNHPQQAYKRARATSSPD